MDKITAVTDFSAPELDVYARLSERELLRYDEPLRGRFIAESPKVIERALDAGYEPLSLLLEPRHIEGEAREIVARCDVPVYTAPLEVLTQLVGFRLTRGVLCAMRRKPEPTPERVCAQARRVAVLEDVMNPTNVGAIFRSAAALGMDAVLLTRGCADPLYRRAVRVSMGNVFLVPWTHVDADWSERLHAMGFRTAAMALSDASVRVDDPSVAAEPRLAVVLGTEGDGLAAATITRCDYTVRIPMQRGVDSLNVAAASAVAFWELGKQASRADAQNTQRLDI
ncbi:MAG: RNA methyltransferase [Oscillospiraceae bacterium]|nr:RNA methyltransferase [Oscillospiraceae bacterium]